MHIHILGICGTFMGGIAQIAHALGHQVTGSDQNIYPPMSDQLKQQGITFSIGYAAEDLQPIPDLVIVGNAISRGNPALEYVLNEQLPFRSGPEWLYEAVLKNKHVLAVSGTHGKTTTTAILTWILEFFGERPGFLIGGVAENFGISSRYTDSKYFLIEADEYDTAFFDKRSKFIHYRPKTLIINNIEFDHADIFHSIADIKREFSHLLKVLSKQARVIYPEMDVEIQTVLAMGCWSDLTKFAGPNSDWIITDPDMDYQNFSVTYKGIEVGRVSWSLLGEYNANNALAAIIAADHIGIPVETACLALSEFKSVKRRLECIMDANGVRLYDDFAHHPTAIRKTLKALRQHAGDMRIIVIMEPRSNTMKMGVHANTLAASFIEADMILIFQADNVHWNIADHILELGQRCCVFTDIENIVARIRGECRKGDHIIIMSNGNFGGIHQKLIKVLS